MAARTCAGAIKTPLQGADHLCHAVQGSNSSSVQLNAVSHHTPVREPATTITATRGLTSSVFRLSCADNLHTFVSPSSAAGTGVNAPREPEPVTRAGPTPCRSGVSPASHSTIQTRGLPAGWAAIYPSRRSRSSCDYRANGFQLRAAPCSRQRPKGPRRTGCTAGPGRTASASQL